MSATPSKEVTTKQVRAVRFGFYTAEEVRALRGASARQAAYCCAACSVFVISAHLWARNIVRGVHYVYFQLRAYVKQQGRVGDVRTLFFCHVCMAPTAAHTSRVQTLGVLVGCRCGSSASSALSRQSSLITSKIPCQMVYMTQPLDLWTSTAGAGHTHLG